jgi:hypothetical protein
MAGKPIRSRVGLFSRRGPLRQLDGRTREGAVMRETTRALLDHLGGEHAVTPPQRLLVETCGVLALRVKLACDRMVTGQGDLEALDRHLIALVNSLRLNLLALGLERPKDQAPSLASYLELKAQRVA